MIMCSSVLLARCNEIQSKVFGGGITNADREEFRNNAIAIRKLGYKLSKRRIRDWNGQLINIVWSLKKIAEDNSSTWVKYAPPCEHNNQCTTRSLFFVLGESIAYKDIREEQNRNARNRFHSGRCFGWNIGSCWENVLLDRGYVKIHFPMVIKAYRVAKMMAHIDSRICVHANHHALSVYGGKVYDSWDSTNQKCDWLICNKNVEQSVRLALEI